MVKLYQLAPPEQCNCSRRVEMDLPVDITSLKVARLIGQHILQAKIFLQGEIKRSLTIKGLAVSKGARAAIEAAGGKVEE